MVSIKARSGGWGSRRRTAGGARPRGVLGAEDAVVGGLGGRREHDCAVRGQQNGRRRLRRAGGRDQHHEVADVRGSSARPKSGRRAGSDMSLLKTNLQAP